jgi:hypothetical protein
MIKPEALIVADRPARLWQGLTSVLLFGTNRIRPMKSFWHWCVLTLNNGQEPGFHGHTQDLKAGKWYAVSGKDHGLPGCHCDAWVDEIPAPPASG